MRCSPEFKLLLACCRVRFDGGAEDHARQACADVRDWNMVLQLASRHSVSSLLCHGLSESCNDLVPPEVVAKLRYCMKANAVRNLSLTRDLLEVTQSLAAASIAAIPYKGPTLAIAAYCNLALREFVDLDLLVRFADVVTARDVLLRNGWRPEYQMSAEEEAVYLQQTCEYNFHRSPQSAVELHWQIVPPHLCMAFDMDRWWARTKSTEFGGQRLLALDGADLLLGLCVHGTKHLWSSLHWLCDIAELVRASSGLDWDILAAEARTVGAERILDLALHLSHKLLDAPVPAVLLKQTPQMAKLAEQIMGRLIEPPVKRNRIRDHMLFLKTRERWQDRIRYLWRVGSAWRGRTPLNRAFRRWGGERCDYLPSAFQQQGFAQTCWKTSDQE
jgi:putative nucleotidyltransferase-like protein